ncbi:hypothetical protein ACJRO7_004447 [Eucalyptus globulus]|uniref:RNase H type-1 domain-containing protein n=1 Tax=Eucalyptus globulus TaxID=34317 RepID=A0ABD3J2H6_EUCGL
MLKQIKRIDQWLSAAFASRKGLPEREFIAGILWQIWKARNSRIFRGKIPSPTDVLDLAQTQNLDFSRGRKKNTNHTTSQRLPEVWTPPGKGQLKVNVNASWVPGENLCSVAGIARDEEGSIVDGFAAEARASSSAQAEAEALLHGLRFILNWKSSHVKTRSEAVHLTCESDSLAVVNFVMGRAEIPWNLREIIQRCRQELFLGQNVTVVYCPREANQAADWLVRTHRAKKLPPNWVHIPPLSLWNILVSECNPSLCSKTT